MRYEGVFSPEFLGPGFGNIIPLTPTPQYVRPDYILPNEGQSMLADENIPVVYDGTSFQAFNLILLDNDGSMRMKTIRGFDRDSQEYSENLKSILTSDPNYRLHICNLMRNNDLITIKDGRLIDNPVQDPLLVNVGIRNENAYYDLGTVYADIETGWHQKGLYTIENSLVLKATDLLFYDAPDFGMDLADIDPFLMMEQLIPIENSGVLEELDKQILMDFDNDIKASEDMIIEPAPDNMNPKAMEAYYREQFQKHREEKKALEDVGVYT